MLSFKAFLSHRYKSPEVNLYFSELFNTIANVQFEVDDGSIELNVTRLEKMVRNADAFIGIYPFPGSKEESNSIEILKSASKYFRLEIDFAIRSQKPAVIFYDKRYGDLIKTSNILSHPFDINEITGAGGFPQLNKHKKVFINFCEIVKNKKKYDDVILTEEKTTIALILNEVMENKSDYNSERIEMIKEILSQFNYTDLVIINNLPVLDNRLLNLLDSVEMVIIDTTGQLALSGLQAYLHAKFIPMIKLKHSFATDSNNILNNFLHGGVEVGYQKDIVEWDNLKTLKEVLLQKLKIIKSNIIRINTDKEAQEYFRGAALMKESIFLSYSGNDIDFAKELSKSLKKYFSKVFDYKDGESIRPGQPWIEDIFNQLSASAIGICLLSSTYIQSGNCMHELDAMVAKFDSREMKLFPVKVNDEKIRTPSFLNHIQYLRRGDFNNTDEIAERILALYKSKK